MEPIEVLGKFVGSSSKFLDPWRSSPFLAEPEFPLQDADIFWSVGTCGHTLIAYKGKVAGPMKGSPKLPFLWITRDSTSIQVTRKELLEWTGVEHPGLIGFDDKPVGISMQGRMLAVGFDLRKLSHLMEYYPEDNLHVWESTHVINGVKSLVFDSEDGMWRGVLAGLDGDLDQKKVFKRSEAEYTDAFRMMLEM
jgi:hypothetical protein